MLIVKEINPIEALDFGQDIADVGKDVIESLFSIEQNVILIILIALAVCGLSITFIQSRRVRARNNVVFSRGYHHRGMNGRLTSYEAKTEYAKLGKLLREMEKNWKLKKESRKTRKFKSQKNQELENKMVTEKDYS